MAKCRLSVTCEGLMSYSVQSWIKWQSFFIVLLLVIELLVGSEGLPSSGPKGGSEERPAGHSSQIHSTITCTW